MQVIMYYKYKYKKYYYSKEKAMTPHQIELIKATVPVLKEYGVTLTTHFYKRMLEGAVPTTSAINEQNYIDYFEPVLKDGQDIYYVTFSHKLSATFESMDRAISALKEKYPDRTIRTFDTKSISLGAGYQVRIAAEKYNAGATMDELDACLAEARDRTHVYFVVDDLIYLKRGGRISAVTAAFGKLLGIKPLITVVP